MSKEFETTIGTLKENVNSPWFFELMDYLKQPTEKSLGIMERDISRAISSEEKIEVSAEDIKYINDYLNDLVRYCMRSLITQRFKDFVNNMVLMIHNWNTIACDQKITEGVTCVRNFLNYHQSVVHSTELLKFLIKEVNRIQSVKPPAFALSEHYLKSLTARLEGNKKSEELPSE